MPKLRPLTVAKASTVNAAPLTSNPGEVPEVRDLFTPEAAPLPPEPERTPEPAPEIVQTRLRIDPEGGFVAFWEPSDGSVQQRERPFRSSRVTRAESPAALTLRRAV